MSPLKEKPMSQTEYRAKKNQLLLRIKDEDLKKKVAVTLNLEDTDMGGKRLRWYGKALDEGGDVDKLAETYANRDRERLATKEREAARSYVITNTGEKIYLDSREGQERVVGVAKERAEAVREMTTTIADGR